MSRQRRPVEAQIERQRLVGVGRADVAIDVVRELDRRRVVGGAEALAAKFGGEDEAVAEIVFAADGIVILPSARAVVVRPIIGIKPKREL